LIITPNRQEQTMLHFLRYRTVFTNFQSLCREEIKVFRDLIFNFSDKFDYKKLGADVMILEIFFFGEKIAFLLKLLLAFCKNLS
jgi:hypothetical protein